VRARIREVRIRARMSSDCTRACVCESAARRAPLARRAAPGECPKRAI